MLFDVATSPKTWQSYRLDLNKSRPLSLQKLFRVIEPVTGQGIEEREIFFNTLKDSQHTLIKD
jgi:hypothetical protein